MELLKPNGWILIDEADMCKHIEGAQGVVDAMTSVFSTAEQQSKDYRVGLKLVPLLNSAGACSINLHSIDIPLNPISSGIHCLVLCLVENDFVPSTDPMLGALGECFRLSVHKAFSSPMVPEVQSFTPEVQDGWLRDFDTKPWKSTSTLILTWARKGTD